MSLRPWKTIFALSTPFFFMSLASASEELVGYPGTYSTPRVRIAGNQCSRSERITVLNELGETKAVLCKKDYKDCLHFGTCSIDLGKGQSVAVSYNAYNEELGRQTFFFHQDECVFGYGTVPREDGSIARSCLDPYFSISADATEHLSGEVLFIPSLVGLKLPTGETHDGYVIIRDSSQSLSEAGFSRFDFFTGNETVLDPKNIFHQRGFSNYDNTFPFEMVTGPKADEVRKKRNYPGLPARFSGARK